MDPGCTRLWVSILEKQYLHSSTTEIYPFNRSSSFGALPSMFMLCIIVRRNMMVFICSKRHNWMGKAMLDATPCAILVHNKRSFDVLSPFILYGGKERLLFWTLVSNDVHKESGYWENPFGQYIPLASSLSVQRKNFTWRGSLPLLPLHALSTPGTH